MQFRLATLLYLFALLAACMAVSGGWRVLLSFLVVVVWSIATRPRSQHSRKDFFWAAIAVLVGFLFLATLLIPVTESRVRGRRAQELNYLRQIGIALIHYESDHGQFPPPYVTDDQRTPLYSWRVLLLPYLGYDNLAQQFRYDEPWNSPHNRKLLVDVEEFISPQWDHNSKSKGTTNFVAIVGPETVWNPSGATNMRDILDGTGDTIAIMAIGDSDIHWSEPVDVSTQEAVDMLTGQLPNYFYYQSSGYFVSYRYATPATGVVFLDGHAEVLETMANDSDALARLTIAGQDQVVEDYRTLESNSSRLVGSQVHWKQVYGTGLLLAIALLPAIPAARQRIFPQRVAARSE